MTFLALWLALILPAVPYHSLFRLFNYEVHLITLSYRHPAIYPPMKATMVMTNHATLWLEVLVRSLLGLHTSHLSCSVHSQRVINIYFPFFIALWLSFYDLPIP